LFPPFFVSVKKKKQLSAKQTVPVDKYGGRGKFVDGITLGWGVAQVNNEKLLDWY